MRDTSTGMTDLFRNTNVSGSEIRSSMPVISDSTSRSNARRHLNDSLEAGDGVLRSIPGGKTLDPNIGKILDFDTQQILFHNNYMI